MLLWLRREFWLRHTLWLRRGFRSRRPVWLWLRRGFRLGRPVRLWLGRRDPRAGGCDDAPLRVGFGDEEDERADEAEEEAPDRPRQWRGTPRAVAVLLLEPPRFLIADKCEDHRDVEQDQLLQRDSPRSWTPISTGPRHELDGLRTTVGVPGRPGRR